MTRTLIWVIKLWRNGRNGDHRGQDRGYFWRMEEVVGTGKAKIHFSTWLVVTRVFAF